MAAHTPGEWEANVQPLRDAILIDTTARPTGPLAIIPLNSEDVPLAEAVANARVMVKAPRMLDALRDLEQWFVDHGTEILDAGGFPREIQVAAALVAEIEQGDDDAGR